MLSDEKQVEEQQGQCVSKHAPMNVRIVKKTRSEAETVNHLVGNWLADIDAAGSPRSMISYEDFIDYGFQCAEIVESRPAVQADPGDYILLKGAGREIVVHAHKEIWFRTIDTYLFTYYGLLLQQLGEEQVLLNQPETVDSLLDSYWECAQSRRKELPPIVSISKHDKRRKKGEKTHRLFVSAFAKNADANLRWRWVEVRSNSQKKQESLYFDGLPLYLGYEDDSKEAGEMQGVGKNQDAVRATGKFTLVDYIYHEWMTGISLSIEITAILLEFTDETLREKALSVFREEALGVIVASPMLFTRICAARCYFRQILMNTATDGEFWQQKKRVLDAEQQWQATKMFALVHVYDVLVRNRTVYTIDGKYETLHKRILPVTENVPAEEQESALEQLVNQIKRMQEPIDLFEYVEHPKHGLAIFCNPEHKNVSFFLMDLARGQKQNLSVGPYGKTKEYALFRKVHSMIRAAIWQQNK